MDFGFMMYGLNGILRGLDACANAFSRKFLAVIARVS